MTSNLTLKSYPDPISAIAKSTGQSIAQLFTNAEIVTIVDVSGSMGLHDSKEAKNPACSLAKELAMDTEKQTR